MARGQCVLVRHAGRLDCFGTLREAREEAGHRSLASFPSLSSRGR